MEEIAELEESLELKNPSIPTTQIPIHPIQNSNSTKEANLEHVLIFITF